MIIIFIFQDLVIYIVYSTHIEYKYNRQISVERNRVFHLFYFPSVQGLLCLFLKTKRLGGKLMCTMLQLLRFVRETRKHVCENILSYRSCKSFSWANNAFIEIQNYSMFQEKIYCIKTNFINPYSDHFFMHPNFM